MLLSTFKAGREWDPYSDQQIYFIKEGSCTLDAYDRKFVVEDTALRVGMGDAPAMADSGPLAHVLIQGGRAVGTLGHEEEMRRMRRQLIPKKLMAKLGVGGLFGGGPAAMGEGEMQVRGTLPRGADGRCGEGVGGCERCGKVWGLGRCGKVGGACVGGAWVVHKVRGAGRAVEQLPGCLTRNRNTTLLASLLPASQNAFYRRP